ncbi:VTT domain-containing protein [Bordetella sp. FB-8]|uniref:VTT domain-containing protein n=1 Tax=Bordetella sp. FB-8 TaxID=1159870 RepID=UPI0003706236|nr:VTT domain-containing protein [Bordetella sp. FB-8]
MQNLQTLLHSYGSWLVFLNVLIEQAGLPIPSYPTLVASGAVFSGPAGWGSAWLLAILACWLADSAWYWAGGRHGGSLLRMICKVSLSRDSCIRQTQSRFLRVGVFALLISKFLPGAGALTNVMNGYAGTPYRRFVAFELLGALIWSGSGLLLGALFSDTVGRVVGLIGRYGKWGLLLLALVLVLYVAVRALRRWALVRGLRVVPRLSVGELLQWQASGRVPVVIDVRPGPVDSVPRIPGALVTEVNAPIPDLGLRDDSLIVVYCACPNEISAASLAARLRAAGYGDAWALLGGYEAWEREARPARDVAAIQQAAGV